jgi:hypothetical protein
MRRVVTLLILVMVAMSLAACGGSPATTDTTGAAGTPAAGAPAAPAPAAAAASSGDILSPTANVKPGQMFPTDKTVVPTTVLSALTAKKPLLVLWLDSSTKVAADQRREVNAAIKKYKGTITLVALDYTAGLASSGTSATLDPETQKVELLASALEINTTPYMLFVDRFGRITYRFAGFTDRVLLGREILRATE